MELQLVSKETAILAKELGFDEECAGCYNENGLNHFINTLKNSQISNDCYNAPTQELLAKWLRDVHNIDALPLVRWAGEDIIVKGYITGFSYDNYQYTKYEDCMEKCLEYGLNLLKTSQEELA